MNRAMSIFKKERLSSDKNRRKSKSLSSQTKTKSSYNTADNEKMLGECCSGCSDLICLSSNIEPPVHRLEEADLPLTVF